MLNIQLRKQYTFTHNELRLIHPMVRWRMTELVTHERHLNTYQMSKTRSWLNIINQNLMCDSIMTFYLPFYLSSKFNQYINFISILTMWQIYLKNYNKIDCFSFLHSLCLWKQCDGIWRIFDFIFSSMHTK